ncbi:hypothetical protein AXX16_3371 [Serratia rubidaea]|nr:hypothetical protein AXX16_3371 [Serratia rubidaea]
MIARVDLYSVGAFTVPAFCQRSLDQVYALPGFYPPATP